MDAHSVIPTIDFSQWRNPATGSSDTESRRAFAKSLCDVCHEVGFFVLVNPGIDQHLWRSIFDVAERFFALPEVDKRALDKRNSRHFRGWEPVGSELTNGRRDVREQVDIWTERPAHHRTIEPPYLRLLGPNQWPSALPEVRAVAQQWMQQLGRLADELLQALSLGLQLDADNLVDLFGPESMSLLKLIRYPATPAGGAGVNAHHDTGFLTLLASDGTPGLEIQGPTGDWVAAPHKPGAFIVNLGELFQAMTGQYFVATAHRVIVREERYSVAYFHGPALSTQLAPLPLAPEYAAAVRASPRHQRAGFMAPKEEIEAGVADMASTHRPAVYGEQLWNYFRRSYPEIVRRHYPD